MSGWEKYVEQAAEAAFNVGDPKWRWVDLYPNQKEPHLERMRAILAVVAPLIAEDARVRIVAAAAAAVERERVDRPKASDLLGVDPDFTGASCSVDYIRWQRGADTPSEYEHVACWSFLQKDGKP